MAKEIAEEIDPDKINLDDPSELLKSLLSGNLDENNDDRRGFVERRDFITTTAINV